MTKETVLIKYSYSPFCEGELEISKAILTYEVKHYFNWFNCPKDCYSIIDRLCCLDTRTYIRFINYLIKKGY